MNTRFFSVLSMILILSLEGTAAEKTVYSESFDAPPKGWSSREGNSIRRAEFPGSASSALHLSKPDQLVSPEIRLAPGKQYQLRLSTFSERTAQLKVGIEEFDEKGNSLVPDDDWLRTLEQLWSAGKKRGVQAIPMTIPFDTSPNGGRIRIVLTKTGNENCYVDDLRVEALTEKRQLLGSESTPPEKKYGRNSLLLPGPDGVLYPNFTGAGLRNWVSHEECVIRVRDFGGIPDDELDDSEAIRRACEKAAAEGGGIVQLEAGTYRLEQKIMVEADGVVIRGAGRDKTSLIGTLPASGVVILPQSIGPNICKWTNVELYFPLRGAWRVLLESGSVRLGEWTDLSKLRPLPRAEEYTKISVSGSTIAKTLPGGRREFRLSVQYEDGKVREVRSVFHVRNRPGDYYRGEYENAYLTFAGRHLSAPASRIPLRTGIRRGDRRFELADASRFRKGGWISIAAPNTKKWKSLTANQCPWSFDREFIAEIESVEGRTVTVMQPFRQDFPLEDGPYATPFLPIQFCGVEDFRMEQTGSLQKELKIGTIHFLNAVNCRALRMEIVRTGGKPLHFTAARNCLLSDAVIRDAWNPQQSLSYVGFDRAYDCRMEYVKTFRMRHAPIFNIRCSGNVIRASTFHESDAQWHMAWCRDNLLEQCRITTTDRRYSSYGYAFYSTPSDDSMHGSNGPFNVIYNCESTSLKSAVYLGGMNRNWRIVYNRFLVEKGPGIIARLNSCDNLVMGNLFLLKDEKSPMVWSEFLGNRGDRLIRNTVCGGNGTLWLGPGAPDEISGNRFLPLEKAPPAVSPPTPSLYLWQLKMYAPDATVKQ